MGLKNNAHVTLKNAYEQKMESKVWKFQDFSITQILREINCAIFGALNFVNLGNFKKKKKIIDINIQSLLM